MHARNPTSEVALATIHVISQKVPRGTLDSVLAAWPPASPEILANQLLGHEAGMVPSPYNRAFYSAATVYNEKLLAQWHTSLLHLKDYLTAMGADAATQGNDVSKPTAGETFVFTSKMRPVATSN